MISASEAKIFSDRNSAELTAGILKYTENKIKESTEQGDYFCVVTYDLGTNTKQIKKVLEDHGYDVKDIFCLYPSLSISWE